MTSMLWIILSITMLLGCNRDGDFDTLPGNRDLEVQSATEWIHFDGNHFRFSDGRQFVVRGLDYKYNTVGYTDTQFDLVEQDFERMASWGVNVLRVRLSDTRAGWYPGQEAENGYLEGLDEIIRLANQYGIYILIANNGAEQMLALYERPDDLLYEQAKFLPGTAAQDHWLDYMSAIFSRYSEEAGVLGFDALNEDFSFPPEVHDRHFIKKAHEALLERLRAVDTRHVYFQQPAGWDYNPDLSVSMGHPLPDENRVFGTKWFALQDQQQRMNEMLEWAEAAGTPLFLCETWVWDILTQNVRTMRHLQRETLRLLDKNTVGWISLGYLPLVGLIRKDREPIHLANEWIRPYPRIVGGTLQSIEYDFDKRQLSLSAVLDGSGNTEVFVPAGHTYPEGFRVKANKVEMVVDENGQVVSTPQVDVMHWDPASQTLLINPLNRAVDVTIESLSSGPVPLTRTRLDYRASDFPPQDRVTRPVFSLEEGENSLRDRMLASGDWTAEQVDCIIQNWKQSLDPVEWEIVARAGLMQVDMRIKYTQAIYECLAEQP